MRSSIHERCCQPNQESDSTDYRRYRAYFDAVEDTFLGDIDYAMLHKIYGRTSSEVTTRYSPAQCIGIKIAHINGNPDPKHISTSYVERQNLTMRMQMRRFTRFTNAFSKKIQNHASAVALHFMYYNFAGVHKTLRITPAMAAGIADHIWEIEEIVALLHVNVVPQKRGPYKKRSA